MKEKKARVEDALHATRAAVEEGIVPGGGVALLRAAGALTPSSGTADELTGVKIIKRACEEPIRQITGNAGYEGAILIEVKDSGQGSQNYGFNAATGEFEDLVEVRRHRPDQGHSSALQNAARRSPRSS